MGKITEQINKKLMQRGGIDGGVLEKMLQFRLEDGVIADRDEQSSVDSCNGANHDLIGRVCIRQTYQTAARHSISII